MKEFWIYLKLVVICEWKHIPEMIPHLVSIGQSMKGKEKGGQ